MNGRYIVDVAQSRVMFQIKEAQPERHGSKVVHQGYPVYKNLRLKGAV